MADAQTRIDQFRKMANDDPGNELGHFSLGQALLESGRADEAIPSFERTLAISPNHSRAHQRLGAALLAAGRRDEAIAKLTAGVAVAHDRGDLMPRDEMVAMLKDLGAPVPEFKSTAAAKQVGEGQVLCKRCGEAKPKLAKPPFRNAFGQQVFENICHDCWQLAIRQGTKVINELRLPLNDPAASKIWDQHIREFLNLQL
jgi:Fe-S cluster biosynthesis and repair protein YggX